MIVLHHQAKTVAEIARIYRLKENTVQRIIDDHYRAKPKPKKWGEPRKDIKAVNYENHHDLSRHYAGAEFEDNRPPRRRGKDWPIKFSIETPTPEE